jgi:hypothetical protein
MNREVEGSARRQCNKIQLGYAASSGARGFGIFQEQWQVVLPLEYRVQTNGGPGPGVFSLGSEEPVQHLPKEKNPSFCDRSRFAERDYPLNADSVTDVSVLETIGISFGNVPGSIAISNYGCGGVVRLRQRARAACGSI